MSHAKEPTGYAIFRAGIFEAVEKGIDGASRWVNAQVVPLCPMSERDELQAKAASLTVELADSRANDVAAMRWLADCRFAVGDGGKRMLPDFVEHLKEIVKQRDILIAELEGEKAASQNYRSDAIKAEKQRDELLAVVEAVKKWDVSNFCLDIPIAIRGEIQRVIASVKGGAA